MARPHGILGPPVGLAIWVIASVLTLAFSVALPAVRASRAGEAQDAQGHRASNAVRGAEEATTRPPRVRAYQVTFGSRYWDAGVDWSPHGKTLAFHRFWTTTAQRPWARTDVTFEREEAGNWGYAGLWSVDLAGRRERRLLAEGVDPRYSPKGDALAYVRPKDGVVAVLSLRTGRASSLTSTVSVAPAWSPDGKRICYLRRAASGPKAGGSWEYVVCDADGRNARPLPLPPVPPSKREIPSFFDASVHPPLSVMPGPGWADWEPSLFSGDQAALRAAWSLDAKRIAMAQQLWFYEPQSPVETCVWDRLWIVGADGRDPRMVAEADVQRYNDVRVWELQWLRSGKALLFTRSGGGTHDGPDRGAPPYRLALDPPVSASQENHRGPTPVGEANQFVKGWRWGDQWVKPVPPAVMEALDGDVEPDAGEVDPYVAEAIRGRDPVWSPDGTRIAFVRDGHVWVVDVPRGAGGK